jgi:hypothetical protein
MTALTRLREAIEGERRHWHTVEVRPDDLAALLDPEAHGPHDDHRLFHGHHPACGYTIEGDWSACCCGATRQETER